MSFMYTGSGGPGPKGGNTGGKPRQETWCYKDNLAKSFKSRWYRIRTDIRTREDVLISHFKSLKVCIFQNYTIGNRVVRVMHLGFDKSHGNFEDEFKGSLLGNIVFLGFFFPAFCPRFFVIFHIVFILP